MATRSRSLAATNRAPIHQQTVAGGIGKKHRGRFVAMGSRATCQSSLYIFYLVVFILAHHEFGLVFLIERAGRQVGGYVG